MTSTLGARAGVVAMWVAAVLGLGACPAADYVGLPYRVTGSCGPEGSVHLVDRPGIVEIVTATEAAAVQLPRRGTGPIDSENDIRKGGYVMAGLVTLDGGARRDAGADGSGGEGPVDGGPGAPTVWRRCEVDRVERGLRWRCTDLASEGSTEPVGACQADLAESF